MAFSLLLLLPSFMTLHPSDSDTPTSPTPQDPEAIDPKASGDDFDDYNDPTCQWTPYPTDEDCGDGLSCPPCS